MMYITESVSMIIPSFFHVYYTTLKLVHKGVITGGVPYVNRQRVPESNCRWKERFVETLSPGLQLGYVPARSQLVMCTIFDRTGHNGREVFRSLIIFYLIEPGQLV